MEMKSSCRKIVLAIFFLPAVVAPQTSTQRKAPPSTPAPNSPISQTLPTPVMHGPTYSPAQLEFGAVELSSSAMRNFSLTTPAAGEITLEFPVGPFTIADVRTVHPLNPSQLKSQMASMPPGKPTPLAKSAYTETYKWSLAAGDEMQFTLIFFPILFNSKPALRTASMKFSGPGLITPWTVTIPLHGTLASSSANMAPPQPSGKNPMATVDSAASTPASAKTSSPQHVPPPASGSVKGASTSIATVPPKGAGISGSVSGESQLALMPTHSPDALYFGAVWQGDSAKQTFHFDNTGSGYIHVDTPLPFQVSEIRALTAGGGSKNSGKGLPQNMPLGPQVKTRVKFTPNQNGPYTALVDAGTNVEVDVVLQPQLQSTIGDKSALMKISGPGAIHDWGMSIPLHGTVAAGLEASPSQLWAIGNDQGAYVNVIIHGTNSNVSGTLKGGGVLPPGISITPQSVNVPASGTFQTQLWLAFNGISTDLKARPLQIVFEAPNHSTSSQIQFRGVPDTALEINSGDRGDCGVSRASLSLRISPPHQYKNLTTKGKRGWVFLGWNYDLLNSRYVEMTADSGGVSLFSHTPFVIRQNTSDQVREFSPYEEDFDVTPEKWAKILQGPANFGCRQWDTTSGGAIAPKGSIKWTPAVQGLKF